jgi:hypothetical protein
MTSSPRVEEATCQKSNEPQTNRTAFASVKFVCIPGRLKPVGMTDRRMSTSPPSIDQRSVEGHLHATAVGTC